MTAGHKHRVVRTRAGSRLYRVLRKPRYVTTNQRRVERSPYPYSPLPSRERVVEPDRYYLSLLGILHRWTGLTLEVKEP